MANGLEETSIQWHPGVYGADAVLQVSVSANQELYEEIRRNSVMCEALRELMKDEIKGAVEEATRETRQNTVLASIKSLMENTQWTAEKAMAALNIPISERSKYASKL